MTKRLSITARLNCVTGGWVAIIILVWQSTASAHGQSFTDLGSLARGRLLPPNQSLAAAEVRWFRFDLPETIDEVDNRFLIVDTLGSALAPLNDTQIGLYDAAGEFIRSDDDGAGSLLSRLSFGDLDGDLPAGQYHLAASGHLTDFGPSNFDVVSSSTHTGEISVNLLYGTDLGELKQGRHDPYQDPLTANGVRWLRFDLSGDVPNRFLRIDTHGSQLDGDNNTELALYDAAGQLLATDDDGGDGLLSRLALGGFGSGFPAGQYFVAASAFDTTHNPNDFDVQSASANEGDLVVNFLHGSDLGVFGQPLLQTPPQALGVNEAQFYRFELPVPIIGAEGGRLIIDTIDSTLSFGNDTELGIYDADGDLIATDDDIAIGVLSSRLAFGDSPESLGDLPAGTYYVAATAYDATFLETDFGVLTDSFLTGDIVLNIATVLLAGDFNWDGEVNSADYVVWRNSLGQVGDGLPADGSGPEGVPDRVVDRFDYDFWKARFAEAHSGGAGVTVPEPATVMLLITAIVTLGARRQLS
jgi:hypothetical protein